MKKKIISLLMVFLIAFACGARIEKPEKIINAEANKEETKVEDDLGYGEHELEVVRANYALSSEQITSKIKADYLSRKPLMDTSKISPENRELFQRVKYNYAKFNKNCVLCN